MKDFISKVTFGFLMAQLLPGLIVVFALSCSILNYETTCNDYSALIDKVGEFWFNAPVRSVIFFFLAISIGMLIHGLNWTVLAWIEFCAAEEKVKTVRGDFLWHKFPVWQQFLISPVVMVIEVLWLFLSKGLLPLMMKENVVSICHDKIEQFTFLQEFYLHFGQFYAHAAYALLICTFCSLKYLSNQFTQRTVFVAFILYCITSIFFLLGRIQLGTLFDAEGKLVEKEEH